MALKTASRFAASIELNAWIGVLNGLLANLRYLVAVCIALVRSRTDVLAPEYTMTLAPVSQMKTACGADGSVAVGQHRDGLQAAMVLSPSTGCYRLRRSPPRELRRRHCMLRQLSTKENFRTMLLHSAH